MDVVIIYFPDENISYGKSAIINGKNSAKIDG